MLDETMLEKIKSKEYREYFNLFGEKVGIELLCKKSDTVNKMIEDEKVRLMYYWYQKTDYKFIPDYVVMQNFPAFEIDDFLENKKYWARLMKIKEFSEVYEGRIVLLKLAYIYGIFNGNVENINYLEFLLKGIPLKISKENYELLIWIEDRIKNAKENNLILPTKEEIENYYNIKEELEKIRLIDKDSKYVFKELYKSNDNEIYNLQFNHQKYPKIINELRKFMEIWGLEVILNPFKAYKIFKDFDFIYDIDFKKFLIENMDLVLTNYEYSIYLSKIQKQFNEIKKLNSNRVLTFNLTLNYVRENDYTNVNVGNEKMADIVGKTGLYNQYNFGILQKIYNYGKIRIYSSIPRIKGIYKDYSYEILKLYDPLALVIGNLTDCCQRLNDNAEICMEHSMVDDNGRLFVVRDKNGQIVAQSWMWRNKNIVCFDDIEIPNKLLVNAERSAGGLLTRYELAEKIYEVYEYASLEFINLDNMTYLNLLYNNLISQRQYNNLKINKVIVGLGHNDIANVIKNKSKLAGRFPVRPLPFNPPVKLNFYDNLYLNDSFYQYVLAETNDKVEDNNDKTISMYYDDYCIYEDNNMTKIELTTLENLRKITDLCNDNLILDKEYNPNKIVSTIAYKYNSEQRNTRIIVHPNFSIIYENDGKCINVLDIFYNTKINNNEQQIDIRSIVIEQIKLALIQITKEARKINMEKLSFNKKCILDTFQLDLINYKILKKVLVK